MIAKPVPFLLAMVFLATITLASSGFAASENDNTPQRKNVKFKNRTIDVAGHLYLPADFDESKKYAAIVVSHPGGGCKEQTSGTYARRMAQEGFVALAFDASHQGESGGEPRYIEDPALRVEDVKAAVDYLVLLPYVNSDRVGALGICAGGGYTVNASMTDKRIKAVGTVVGACFGRSMRGTDPEASIRLLEEIGRQRTVEAQGGEVRILPAKRENPEALTDIDLIEAYEYYNTPRGEHENSMKMRRFTGMANLLTYDSYNFVETLLTQPLQIIIGSKDGAFKSRDIGLELYERAASEDKNLLMVENASHVDLYDKPEYVDQAVERLSAFYKRIL